MKIFGFTLVLCALQYVCGEHAHKVFNEDHYVDGKHNPEHDMNAFLGTEVMYYHLVLLSQHWGILFMLQKPRHTVCADINILTLLTFQDKDEIEKLSPSEQKKRLGEIVNKIDADGDKYLSTGKFSLLCVFAVCD